MASREQIERILKKMQGSTPVNFIKQLNELQMGIGAVLRILQVSQGDVTAGQISETLGVSTARIAVVLKKMVAKGLIVKEKSGTDGRVTIVRLTDAGKQTINEMEEAMREQIGRIIDAIGEERVLQFIDISNDIKAAVRIPELHF